MEKKLLCLFLAMAMLLTGCVGSKSAETEPVTKLEQETKEQVVEEVHIVEQPVLAGEISFELPVSMVRAMIDRNGYLPDREKNVLFLGENITGDFRVIRENDWEIVYTGTIQNGEFQGEASLVNIGFGDFSEVTEPGSYYIEQDRIGRSYTFTISETAYEPLFQGLLQNILSELPQSDQVEAADICDVSFGMHSMMLALQYHGALFEKDNNLVMQLLELAEWLISFQDETTGSMFEDYEATAAFCGVLIQSADTFGKYDANVSKQFTAAAKKAWTWMEKNPEMAMEYATAQFYAATQLYKTEGILGYKTIIEKYLQSRTKKITEDKFAFYGSVIYLNTIQGTDRDLCTRIMQELVDGTEEISMKVKENPYLVYSDDMEQNLQKMLLICFVDYITPSNEYAVILENTLHYLLGRNETGNVYLNEAGMWLASDLTAEKTLEWNGILLFCLSDLLNASADEVD